MDEVLGPSFDLEYTMLLTSSLSENYLLSISVSSFMVWLMMKSAVFSWVESLVSISMMLNLS